MEYRTYKKTGEKVSLLGFGTMRFPILDGDSSKIDEPEAIRMIRHAIDAGVNYIDTAYMYHNGASELVVGKALKDGYREKVFIADKLPIWFAKEASEIETIFENQFKRLDVDFIDFYLLHNLNKTFWEKAKEMGALTFLEKMKAQGRIGKIGFSFHDDLDVFKAIINDYPWEYCQIQLNYMDACYQAGVEGLKYAGEKGIPVIIMEPLKGGKLTESVPTSIQALWEKALVKKTPAEWALNYIADFPEVVTILSGMSTMEQVEDNIRILSEVTSLTDKDHQIINNAAEEYNKLIKASCTNCKYCLPCPQNINIPVALDIYNQWHLYHAHTPIKRDFNLVMREGRRPSNCVNCKVCEERCPQHLPISDIMRETAEIFE